MQSIIKEYSLEIVTTVKDFLLLNIGFLCDFDLGFSEKYEQLFTELANYAAIRGSHGIEGPYLQKYLDKTHSVLEFYFGQDIFNEYMRNHIMVKKLKHAKF